VGYDSFFGRFTADNETTPNAINAEPHSMESSVNQLTLDKLFNLDVAPTNN
jgi:hypothetical protein